MAETLRMVAEWGSALAVVLAWVIAIREYPTLPARFPAHFGITGRPDRWGSRRMVWFMPAVGTAIYVLNRVVLDLAAGDPRQPGVVPAVAWLHFEILAMFLFIEARSIAVARGRASGLGVTFLPITLAVLIGTSLLLRRG
jgi:hypothetical protein